MGCVESPLRQPKARRGRPDHRHELVVILGDGPVTQLVSVCECHERRVRAVHVDVLDRLVVDEHLQQAKAEEHREHELDERPLVQCRRGILAAGHERDRLPVEELEDEVAGCGPAGLGGCRVGLADSARRLRRCHKELGDARTQRARLVDKGLVESGSRKCRAGDQRAGGQQAGCHRATAAISIAAKLTGMPRRRRIRRALPG